MKNNKIKFIIDNRIAKEDFFSPGSIFQNTEKKYIENNLSYGKLTIDEVIVPNMNKFIKCFDPNKRLQKILLFGEVQSGKTNNMIFLTSLLKENNLNEQNIQRFKEYNKNSDFMNFKYENSFFTNTDKTEFLYGLKQNISNLVNNFKDFSPINYENWKIAIIDDESDEASAEKNKMGRTTNNNIELLLNFKVKNLLYIPVTATPYANLLSYTDALIPNFIIPLEASKNYVGLELFNKSDIYQELPTEIIDAFNDKEASNEKLKSFVEDCIINFYKCCKKNNDNLQFLINISSAIKDMEFVKNLIESTITTIMKLKMKEHSYYINKNLVDVENFREFLKKVKTKITMEGHKYSREDVPEIIIGGICYQEV